MENLKQKLLKVTASVMVTVSLIGCVHFGELIHSEVFSDQYAIVANASSSSKKKTPKLSATKKTLYYKAKTTLKVKNYSKKVKWSTSNKKVAKVSSKGVVTAVGLGTCTITAKAGSKKLKCKIAVKDRNLKASISFKVNGGGYFVKDESLAKITVKAKKYNAAKATIYIKNASGDTVYKKTLKKLTKNKSYSFTWNGKNTKGNYVSSGTYRVMVKIGSKKAYSSYLAFYAKNDFVGGCGSSSNPFIIQTTGQLNKMVKYPKGYFKQANDLNFNYTSVGNLFSADQPFNGTYDGNGKTIMNISSTVPLFNTIGETGTVKNLIIKNCNVVGHGGSILASYNYGTISNCNINGIVSVSNTDANSNNAKVALAVWINYGTISNSNFSGTVSSYYRGSWGGSSYAGGVVYINDASGKIISCTSETNATAETSAFYPHAAGIAALNNGIINSCEASGKISGTTNSRKEGSKKEGGIAGENNGQIVNSYYTGVSSINIVGWNKGTIA